jgi:hypothetical protein
MEIDPPSPIVQGSSSRQQAKVYTQIKFQDNQEKEVYKLLKDKEFTSTPVVDPGLLHTIGMDSKCQLIYRNIGWKDAWTIIENDCRLLIIEFLCTLQLGENEISFRLFNKSFSPSWKNFSNMLGFHESCNVDVDDALEEFDRTHFWQDISNETVCH